MREVDIDWDTPEPVVEPEIEYQYVIGIDPGGTTGLAALRYTEETQPEVVYLHQQSEGHAGFWDFFKGSVKSENVTFVSESWVEHGTKGVDREPLKIEGIQYSLWQDEIVYQEPKMKQLVKDSWLKSQNLWTPGKRHQMDALIHAFVYLRNSGHEPTIESLSGQAEQPIEQPGEIKKKELGEDGSGKPEEMQSEGEKLAEAIREFMDGQGEPTDEPGEGEPSDGDAQGQPQGVSDGEPTGGSDDQTYHGDGYVEPDVSVKRKRREKNGVFAGFEPEGGEEVSLLDD